MKRKVNLDLLIVMLISAFVCIQAQAQGTAAQGVQATSVSQAESKPEVSMSEEGLVSLDFREVEIRNVFKILSLKSGVNIVAGPEVSGAVSIQLNNVPWEEALNVILQTYGYAYERKGNIIVVTTVENLKKRREDAMLLAEQEPLVTETFTLNFAKAANILDSVQKMKSERGSVNVDERTNTLIITDTQNNIKLIESVIDKLDATTPQVLIEAKIVETTLNDTENLGIDWVTQATVSGSAIPHTWPFTASTSNKYAKGNSFPDAEDTDFSYGTLDFSQLQAVLELLKTRTDTNILSNPRIVTLDNQEAKIKVGTDRPIPKYEYNNDQATLQVNGFDWVTIGIVFEVTPHVSNAGYVTLDLRPEVSELGGTVAFDNIDLPLISIEEAKTSVMVKDGETLVIAGLITDKTTDIKKKTPFLGDIPLFGLLFQKTSKTLVKTDLLVFLTPHIITPDVVASDK